MKKVFTGCLIPILLIGTGACSSGTSEKIDCWIFTPDANQLIQGAEIQVQVVMSGAVQKVELLVNEELVDESAVQAGVAEIYLSWNVRELPDSEFVLQARATGMEGTEVLSEEVPVKLSNSPQVTAPSLATDPIMAGVVSIETEFSGLVEKVQLLANDQVVSEVEVPSGESKVNLSWDTTALTDGDYELVVKAQGSLGREVLTDPVTVVIDNTVPFAAFGQTLSRLSILKETFKLPLSIEESNIKSIRLLDGDQELFSGTTAINEFEWDTTVAADGVHLLSLEVLDAAGNSTKVEQFPVIVLNHGEEMEIEYIPEDKVTIPENYQEVEIDVRGYATTKPEVRQVVSWLTWDASAGWEFDYAIGQGLCPHRGIRYLNATSNSGEIWLDLKRTDLPTEIVNRLPAADRQSEVFPTNNDPLTFGSFFGHIATIRPEEHINQTIPIVIHFVFIYGS